MSDNKRTEYRKQWGRKVFICECGSRIKTGSKYTHLKSKKHKMIMENINLKAQQGEGPPLAIKNTIRELLPQLSEDQLTRIVLITQE